jgi:hypothetical protein
MGHPDDNEPTEWFEAAILCDDNHIANNAFQVIFHPHKANALAQGVVHITPALNSFTSALKLTNPIQMALCSLQSLL